MNPSRTTNTLPTYDFLSGGASSPPSSSHGNSFRQSFRTSQTVRPDTGNEELRVQVNTLTYELENIKQERDLVALRHEKEVRDLQVRADADFKKAQAAETASHKAQYKNEALSRELKEAQDNSLNEKASLERKIRTLQEQNQSLQEDVDDAQARLSDQERHQKYQVNELETIRAALQKTVEELQIDLQGTKDKLHSTQERVSQQESSINDLETENIRLKADGSDAETLTVLKRELSDQVTHIKKLESTNKDQTTELRYLRKIQKNVEVVEEQKKSLENQLHLMKDVESELGSIQIQKQILENERRSWTSLLETNGQEAEFDSPEAVVRALVQERIEKASLVNRIGNYEPQITEKNEIINSLESDKARLQKEMEKLRANGAGAGATDNRSKTRLERQRTLAVKEVEYLRAQLKAFEDEETTMNVEEFDTRKTDQVNQLQALIDQYRTELTEAHEELSKQEQPQADPAPRGTKRPLSPAESDADSERLAVLVRKNRTLQDSLSKAEQSTSLLHHELDATKSQLSTLQAQSRTRILELRANPTAEAQNIKLSTLQALKAENQDLLAQLRGNHADVKVIPISALETMRLEMEDMKRTVAEKEKRMKRLKEIWTAKSSEFREAVASVLGYKLDFMPNGRVRVTSMFHLSPEYRHGGRDGAGDGPGSMGDGEENSIIFDGENGTMKISGGPNSLFALEIKPLIKFWVEERKDIPCFLAAMTLDFYDKTTRAARI
ncbi:coiled-coil domain-containing protein mad1 [Arachnomyces sp. PD_36]|nr:coiled-coil domain-containing protein mad1 [Arachnomyces sp. PD_36]